MATRSGIRRRNENNCRRKIAYDTFKDARERARLVRHLIHELVLAYRCPLPSRNHYHLGHPQQLNGLSWNDYRSGKYDKDDTS